MKVELISYSNLGEAVCGIASKTCVSEEIPTLGAVTLRIDEEPPLKKALKNALGSGHESVVEHLSFTFAISGVSRALTHQLVRHRLASFSQQSQRYVNMDEFEYVMPESIQNSTSNIWLTSLEDFANMSEVYNALMGDIQQVYEQMVELGIPEEDARYILPNACTTNIVVSMNARELRHFFALRCCTRAQWEIRELANKMLELCKEVAPVIFADAGASCVASGKCPEGKKSCGKIKKGQMEE